MDTNIAKELMARHKVEFDTLLSLLIKWNKTYNLTAITAPKDIIEKHFLDSIIPVELLPENCELLDIGTGGGFPGIPIKIVRPDINVTLIEATKKKCNFCENVIRELKLNNITVVNNRIENAEFRDKYSHRFDIIISRATFKLNDLVKFSAGLLKSGNSKLIAMKSENIDGEINDASAELHNSGLKIMEIRDYSLAESRVNRKLVIVSSR